MDQKEMSSLSAMLSNFSTRINDTEEKQNMITEKLSLISQTLLKNSERIAKEMTIVSDEMSEIKNEMDKLKESVQILLEQSGEFARKQELQVVEKYMKIWEPMKFATIDDVRKMINDAVKNKKASSKDRIIPVEE